LTGNGRPIGLGIRACKAAARSIIANASGWRPCAKRSSACISWSITSACSRNSAPCDGADALRSSSMVARTRAASPIVTALSPMTNNSSMLSKVVCPFISCQRSLSTM